MYPSTVYCDNCGAANRPQARFCIACGQMMPAASSLPPTVQAASGTSSTPPTVLARSAPSSPSLTGLLPAHSLLNQRYLILSRLGRGGMGAVYKAADTQLGDRLVAVKEMSQKGLDPQEAAEAAEAFKREAIMLAGLFERHLPRIYDHFADGGRWYLVMDFIAGETLEERLDKAGDKLPVAEVLDISIQLCSVLGYLHTHQPPIIFRDLKPANVMRTPDGDLFLIDFGIARHFKAGQARDTIAYGSAGYAAPEQYGKAQTTPQSDIYSLGATLHHLLSGNDPSQSPFVFAPLTGAAVPADLAMLIIRMVKTEAYQRPASMADVKKELQRIAAQPTGSQLAPTQPVVPTPALVVPMQSVLPKQQPKASPPLPSKPMGTSPPQGTVLYTYRGHRDMVSSVAWSPDSRRIASGSLDKTVQVWDATTGENLLIYRGHPEKVCAVAWSPDGTRIISGGVVSRMMGESGNVKVWDAQTGAERLTCGGHGNWWVGWIVTAVVWSPDGKRIASGGNKTLQVLDATTGRTLLTYHNHSYEVLAVAWSPDSRRIASGGNDKTVQIWDATTGKCLLICNGHTDAVAALVWSPDSRRIASGSLDKTVQVWDAVTGKTLLICRGHASGVASMAWSPDCQRIASGSLDKTVQIWDATNGGNIYTYLGHFDGIWSVAWSPDGTRIASASRDKMVQVWQAS